MTISTNKKLLGWAVYYCATLFVASTITFAQEQPGAAGTGAVDSPSKEEWVAMNESLSVKIVEVKRTKHNTLKLRFQLRNNGTEKVESFPGADGITGRFYAVYLRHIPSRVELRPLHGGASGSLCSAVKELAPGKTINAWAEYPSLPAEINDVTVAFGSNTVIDDVPVR